MILKRTLPVVIALGAAALGAACDDTTGLEAQYKTFADTFVVYALSGTAPQLPTAFNSVAPAVLRVDTLEFDVAFDITSDGRVALYPISTVAFLRSPRRVAMRVDSTTGFESLQRAPSRGYVVDSVVVVPVGRTVILEVPGACNPYTSLSPYVYTKLVVDAVDPVTRRIDFHTVHNPNCGYRTLRPGVVPEN